MLRPCLSAGGEEGGAVVDQKGVWGVDEGVRDSRSGMSLGSSDGSTGGSSELFSRAA